MSDENDGTKQLWLVEIHDDDFAYDRFVAATVWAETAEEAEQLMRAAPRRGDHSGVYQESLVAPWIASTWRLTVKPAPTEGVALVHWRAR